MSRERSTKVCTRCEKRKPLAQFYRRKTATDGLVSNCKACMEERRTAWRKKNRERDNANTRRYKARNRNRLREYDAQYKRENRAVCPECGYVYGIGSGTKNGPGTRVAFTSCPGCRDQRWDRIEAMWAAGRLMPEIATELGMSQGHLSVDMNHMRAAGRHLPYRYKWRDAKHPDLAKAS